MAVVYMFMIPFRALHHHFYYKSNLDSTIWHVILETDNPSKVFELDDIIVRDIMNSRLPYAESYIIN